ncbi:hypothetical protein D0C17_13460 [Vibrio cholerae]|nr:hypothetical protein [Vibrio cholerae]
MKLIDHILAKYWIPRGVLIDKQHLSAILIGFSIVLTMNFLGVFDEMFTFIVLCLIITFQLIGAFLARFRFGDTNPNQR